MTISSIKYFSLSNSHFIDLQFRLNKSASSMFINDFGFVVVVVVVIGNGWDSELLVVISVKPKVNGDDFV